jgi:hypothetical protein
MAQASRFFFEAPASYEAIQALTEGGGAGLGKVA